MQGHDLAHVKLGCNRIECPECHYRIAVREAYKAVARLRGLWHECRIYGLDLGRPAHVVTSPPPDEYHNFKNLNLYSKINKRNQQYLKEIGIIGGCTTIHRVRGKPHAIKAYKAGKIELKDAWHWHTVGFMPEGHKIDSPAFYDATGWIYKNIPIITKGGARNVIAYELNHAAAYQVTTGHSHLLRWWGATSYNNMRLIETKTKEIKECKACKADKHRYWETYDDDQGEAFQVKVDRQIQLTPSQLARVASRISAARTPRPEKITEYQEVTS